MGTAGFITFVVDGDEKTTYNHCDSYPDYLGANVLEWLRFAATDVDALREQVKALRVVAPDSTPTAEDIERLHEFANTGVGSRELTEWYVLLRETQGRPGEMLRAGVIEDAREFPQDSLFAEWGYVVDLDAGAFEVYEGFRTAPHGRGRFADRPGQRGYYPVALVKSWPFNALPTDEEFLAALGGGE